MEGQPRQPPSLRGLDEIEQRFDLQQDEVQKLTNKFILEIDKHLAEKEADILKV